MACRRRPRAPQTRLERLRRGGGGGRYPCLCAALAAAGALRARRGQRAAPRPWPPRAVTAGTGRRGGGGSCSALLLASSPGRLRTPGSPRAAAEAAEPTAGDGEIAARERPVSTGGGWARRGECEPRSLKPSSVGASLRVPGGPGRVRGTAPAGSGPRVWVVSQTSDLGGGAGVKRSVSCRSARALGPLLGPGGRRLRGCELLPHRGQ